METILAVDISRSRYVEQMLDVESRPYLIFESCLISSLVVVYCTYAFVLGECMDDGKLVLIRGKR